MRSRAILRMDIGFYIGTIFWALLESLCRIRLFGAPKYRSRASGAAEAGASDQSSGADLGSPDAGICGHRSVTIVFFFFDASS